MRHLLSEISRLALQLNEYDFAPEQKQAKWIGTYPASEEEIKAAQLNLGTTLPDDYIEFLKTTNGFPQFSVTGVTFLPVTEIDYLVNIDNDLVEIWSDPIELREVGQDLAESILVGGRHEQQYFLLIPPNTTADRWQYWFFASWAAGQIEYENLSSFLEFELSKLIKKGSTE